MEIVTNTSYSDEKYVINHNNHYNTQDNKLYNEIIKIDQNINQDTSYNKQNEYTQTLDIRAEIETTQGILFIYKNPNYDSIEDLISFEIGNHITEIGDECFAEYNNFNTIIIPNTVTKIGNGSFKNMINLKEIIIPDSVIEIGKECFRYDYNLTSIKISTNLKSLPEFCFANCINLESITLPKTITKLARTCFHNCKNLKNINMSKQILLNFIKDFKIKFNGEIETTIGFKNGEIPYYFHKFKNYFFNESKKIEVINLIN